MSFQIGDMIGDYQVIELLGVGGMGKVYKVRNLISDRIEAAKILGVPISTVRSRLSTGRDRLRRMMEMTNDEMLSTAPHLQNAKPHAPHRYSGFAAPRRVTPFRAHCDFGSFVAVLEGGCPQ